MKGINQKDVAEYFNVTPELLPYIPELLSDIWALGSSPELIVEWLRLPELSSKSAQVLDVGCGKGAVAITIAEELGFSVYGVDFFEPFVLEAKRRAEELRVSDLCRFEHSDMRDTLTEAKDFDIVIFSAVGFGVFGSVDQCVGQLRQSIHSNGLMIIDDGFRAKNSRVNFPGYEHYVSYKETVKQLTAHGDTIIKEKVFPFEDIKLMNQQDTEFITKRARNLAQQHPELADLFFHYVEQQKQECEIVENDIATAIWLLQKA
jgi:cyclopropane fatty-acyl-phospholipid synthase-like methyltransferase